jgi:LysM domain
MSSLSAHLREPGDHGRLSFHPDCPQCRDRVSGVLPADSLVSRRTQALVAAGVMALSSGTSATALAQEPDQEREGTAAPEAVATDPAADPDFDSGGTPTELPLDTGVVQDPQADDATPIEDEAAIETEVEVAVPGDEAGAPSVTPPASPVPTPAPAPAPAPAPEPVAPVAEAPAPAEAEPAEPAREHDAQDRRKERKRAAKPNRAPAPPRSAPTTVADATTPVPAATTVQPAASTVQAAPAAPPVARSERASRGDRFHVVQPGESLWTIARDLTGKDASVVAVAREVNALWELNDARIGTGDPDLLMAGTRLALK